MKKQQNYQHLWILVEKQWRKSWENGAIDNLELKIGEKKRINTIYIEADEDHIPLQNGKSK